MTNEEIRLLYERVELNNHITREKYASFVSGVRAEAAVIGMQVMLDVDRYIELRKADLDWEPYEGDEDA